jgi:DNA repair photolyase
MQLNQDNSFVKGRGAQVNVHNKFEKRQYTWEEVEPLAHDDDLPEEQHKTEYITVYPKTILNKVDSPDLGMVYSMNPYQGCEHGCIYCYARNTHEYWGYSAGHDFESKILVKENAPELLRAAFDNKRWKVEGIMFSGNTDCYQPAERKFGITRKLLEVFLEYRHPVGMITKNSLILRDLDIIKELAAMHLISVSVSITSLDESLRQKMEPRTTTATQRLRVVEQLSNAGVPVNVMVAPIVPGLNDHEIPDIIKAAAERGAISVGYTIVRLNGAIGEIFTDWVRKTFPDRANKVLKLIQSCHGGTLNDSRWGTRMKGEGQIATTITNLFKMAKSKYMAGREWPEQDITLFKRPERGQLSLF